MKLSNRSSSKQNAISPRIVAVLFLALAVCGFTDASYLAVRHYRGHDLTCGPWGDCGEVTTSSYANVFGVPVSLIGAAYYLCLALLSVAYFDTKRTPILTIIAYLTLPGFAASMVFLYLQFFVLQATCPFCMLSALISTGLFGTAVGYLAKAKSVLGRA